MSVRTERVAELLQRELSLIFQKELPRNGALTTIQGVKVSPDLSIAHVYISVLGSKEMAQSVLAHIRKESKFFRKELSARIRHQFRRMPELEFHLDEAAEKAARLEMLIREANQGSKPSELPS
ncbi:MAG: 30S ribosome-binding factor RbfA [Candidatus Thermochlorobacter aerophilum]|jgi:ribosome-binding factor A|uniref:Ribosome-binding factor A n=1 Tax=Candidatus Thermochlorobacter aerophilus TaxID=1868324 RepID=A0A395LZ07_9BACT|nr:MAG: 30S ribosome-binding factor RbfA [Candidatus Thermochlorobacter aerophilum]